jgi:hypothetical protein
MAEEVQKISEAIVDQEKEKSVPKFQFHSIPESKTAPFTDNFTLSEGLAMSQPGGFVLTPEFGRHYDEFLDFQIRKDDAWVVTFPKCGKNHPTCCQLIKVLTVSYLSIKEQLGLRKWFGC